MLIVTKLKLYSTASGIITLIGGRHVHRLREDSIQSSFNPVLWWLKVQEIQWCFLYVMISRLTGGRPYESKYSAYPKSEITDSYPMRNGHVMLIKVNENY